MNFDCKIVDEMASEIAGFKSVTLEIEGEYAHGWFQYEQGVHRFVRISPFDSNGKRHTSFVSVRIYPMMSDSVSEQIQISPADLKIETMRAGGAGGQHVNKTESAVRIVHLPTGLSVHSQSQRSQHQNKQKAMDMLKARLYELEIRKRESEKAAQHLTLEDNAWGSQIKSYVLHPYQMIKDLRTGHERNDVANVLDGDLGSFTETALVHHRKK
jgi:peptide chain release factor 2